VRPFDFARWEAVAQRPATALVELTVVEARERLGDVDPDVGARDLLPVLVRRGPVVHLFSEVENLQEGDRVLAIRDA
jgi:hypothetical protein